MEWVKKVYLLVGGGEGVPVKGKGVQTLSLPHWFFFHQASLLLPFHHGVMGGGWGVYYWRVMGSKPFHSHTGFFHQASPLLPFYGVVGYNAYVWLSYNHLNYIFVTGKKV